MPYASLSRPSMALGLLKAILACEYIEATVLHTYLLFAETVGLRRYEVISEGSPIIFLAGEWTFAEAAFPEDPRREEKDAEFLRQMHEAHEPAQVKAERSLAARRTPADALISDL